MITISQGNILKVTRATNCTLSQAEEALKNTNSWPDAFNYAKRLME